MHKKRIAFFAENLYGGGVERILQIILRNFDYEKNDVTLYSARPEILQEEFYPTHLKQHHYFDVSDGGIFNKFKCLLKNKLKLWVYYHCSPRTFYKLFIRKEYDVAIAFIEGYATRIVSGASNNTKKLSWLHTDIENNHWTDVAYQNREEERKCYLRYDKIVCVSQVVEEKAKKCLPVEGKTKLLHNPIEVDSIKQKSLQYTDLPSIQFPRIFTLGSLIKVKGYERLLRVCKKLVDEGYNFVLYILGRGNEESTLKEFVKQNNLDEAIRFLGFQENPYPYLASADVYVCSSFAEGFNTAISEALILGIPVVTTEVSGTREQLGENSEYGIITDNNEEALYEGLKLMLNDEVRIKYKQKAIERGSIFSLDESMNQIYSLIES